ncbi:MAG: pknB 20 [Schlesneria sp.]|nr:pknB 20 [Schlesneria sp.]
MSAIPSANDLMQQWAAGEESAAELLYARYAQRLLALADSYLSAKLRQRVDPDDILQSVFRTFFKRVKAGQYAIDHSGALWRLLVQITLNKVRGQVQFHRAEMRDVDAEIPLTSTPPFSAQMSEPGLDEGIALTDELNWLVRQLQDPEPVILQLWWQGYSVTEIARQIGSTASTVQRTRNHIRQLLKQRLLEEF